MKTSISVGGRVLPVVIMRSENGYAVSYSDEFCGEPRNFVATGENYEGALRELRAKLIAARIFP
jgi:hypothetical protein